MVFSSYLSWSHQNYWREFSLDGFRVKVRDAKRETFQANPTGIPPYFWGKSLRNSLKKSLGRWQGRATFPIHPGYVEARHLIGSGTVPELEKLSIQARELVADIFSHTKDVSSASSLSQDETPPYLEESRPRLVRLQLSLDLQRWKEAQHSAGNILPPKGSGLTQSSEDTLRLLGAAGWPKALRTNNALFGCGIASLLIGAADAPTMFSNYVTDMAFYYEHGYNHVFPSLEPLLQRGLQDPYALRTLGGLQRRECVFVGKRYIQDKIALEEKHMAYLTNQSASLSRREAQVISLSESSLLGMAAEAMARGFDQGAVMSDMVFSSPGTDVVDVGCDLINSEVMNSFLNTADITDTGVVSEDVLRKVYDAYAATGARMLTQRWHEPVARMCAALYTWHIQNDRHLFLRRALLGWPKARKVAAKPQCEADFDEVFDEHYRTTGFSRPLSQAYVCSGEDTCDHVCQFLDRKKEPLLQNLWQLLVVDPLEYVRNGQVDERREHELVEGSRLLMAELYSRGLVLEMTWLIAHANHHAWQVNYLFEAAMFGSILDGGALVGQLDRQERSQG